MKVLEVRDSVKQSISHGKSVITNRKHGIREGGHSSSLHKIVMHMALKPDPEVPIHCWAHLLILKTGSGLSEVVYFSLLQ